MSLEPYLEVRYDDFLAKLQERIADVHLELIKATGRDAVASAEARLTLFREKEEKVLDDFRRSAIEGLRLGYTIGYGFIDTSGSRTIIRPAEWPRADIDWAKGTVTVEGRRYTDVRFVRYNAGRDLSIQHAINRDLRAAGEFVPYGPGEEVPPSPSPPPPSAPQEPIYSTGAPGKPTSIHLVEQEMRRRAAATEMATTLTAEAAHLEAWLRTTHPLAPPLTEKTIRNRLGDLYRSLSGNVFK